MTSMSCHQPRVWIGNAGDVSSGLFSFLKILLPFLTIIQETHKSTSPSALQVKNL